MEGRIFQELRAIVGERGLITSPEELHTYECDGLTAFRALPQGVLLPKSTEEVQAIVRVCHRERMPFVARGAGTGLSGGALPVENGIVISLARMNRILEVDFPNARVVVEPGVVNLDVTGRVIGRRIFLRARSVVPNRLQHWRQRGGKFRRGALPEVRIHYDARAGTRSGVAGRIAGAPRRQDSG